MPNSLNNLQDFFASDFAAYWGPPAIAFMAVVAIGWLIARRLFRKPTPVEARLNKVQPQPTQSPDSQGLFGSLTPALAAQLPESRKERRDFQRWLRSAGLYGVQAAATIYALRFVLLVVPLLAAGVLAVIAPPQRTWTILIGGAIVAAALSIVPRLYVFARRRRRLKRIRRGLPDTMDMLGMCMGGGLGLSESLLHVAGQLDSYPELAEELLILNRQAEVGSLQQALADLADRVDLAEVRQLAGLLTRGERLGTRLSGTLMQQSDHLRTSRKQLATMQANKTPVKLVLPLMFCFAPATLILLIAPAALELNNFLHPAQGQSILSGNESLSTDGIVDALDELDQDMSGVDRS